ncbi:hypothetical protein FB472_1382 [Rhodoglobus vestalii]|uniref:Uncharacterized protein n=1 Tax=Rhodoglobus vestalii TaxID=193384 RepID=A0A8H2K6X4_9MICO|nr:hypothetical protein FB472_1382 [Rhodoglobus vestalii]
MPKIFSMSSQSKKSLSVVLSTETPWGCGRSASDDALVLESKEHNFLSAHDCALNEHIQHT